jgi:hypothetical protein
MKIYNNLVLPTFLYGSENWTLTASQRRRIEAAEKKFLRPLAGYALLFYMGVKLGLSQKGDTQAKCVFEGTFSNVCWSKREKI